jgi:hypothetical protein
MSWSASLAVVGPFETERLDKPYEKPTRTLRLPDADWPTTCLFTQFAPGNSVLGRLVCAQRVRCH